MPKNIVICADGTWNRPRDETNIWQLFNFMPGEVGNVLATDEIGAHQRRTAPEQISFYLQGVGTRFNRSDPMAGAIGMGLHDKVLDGYLLVSQVYERGDNIFLFGFSRGAYTARSLAGFIANAGLLPQEAAKSAGARHTANALWWDFKKKKPFEGPRPQSPDAGLDTLVTCVGVWDTVGAQGVPLFNGVQCFDKFEKEYFDFADTDLHPRVANGRHALAIDEKRKDFKPTFWSPRHGVVEKWFAGVHSDVGGGYAIRSLSDISLIWMLDEACRLGLLRDDAVSLPDPVDPSAPRHESCRSFWKLGSAHREIADDADLHPSVHDRFKRRGDYRPNPLARHRDCAPYYTPGDVKENVLATDEDEPTAQFEPLAPGLSVQVMASADRWWNGCGIEVRAGEQYRITAQGTWHNGNTACDANGCAASGLRLVPLRCDAQVLQLCCAVSADPTLERQNASFFKGLFRATSDEDASSDITPVGTEQLVDVKRDGCLYLFANDAAQSYGNNSGSLDVTITRVS